MESYLIRLKIGMAPYAYRRHLVYAGQVSLLLGLFLSPN
jgi:hypothetical protein